MTIIKNMIEKHHQNKYSKIMYQIKDLYVGEIVFLKPAQHNTSDCRDYSCTPIKKLAIFNQSYFNFYSHIKSQQKLREIAFPIIEDYAIINLQPFSNAFADEMKAFNLTNDSAISKLDILQLETMTNQKLAPNQKVDKLFGM